MCDYSASEIISFSSFTYFIQTEYSTMWLMDCSLRVKPFIVEGIGLKPQDNLLLYSKSHDQSILSSLIGTDSRALRETNQDKLTLQQGMSLPQRITCKIWINIFRSNPLGFKDWLSRHFGCFICSISGCKVWSICGCDLERTERRKTVQGWWSHKCEAHFNSQRNTQHIR